MGHPALGGMGLDPEELAFLEAVAAVNDEHIRAAQRGASARPALRDDAPASDVAMTRSQAAEHTARQGRPHGYMPGEATPQNGWLDWIGESWRAGKQDAVADRGPPMRAHGYMPDETNWHPSVGYAGRLADEAASTRRGLAGIGNFLWEMGPGAGQRALTAGTDPTLTPHQRGEMTGQAVMDLGLLPALGGFTRVGGQIAKGAEVGGGELGTAGGRVARASSAAESAERALNDQAIKEGARASENYWRQASAQLERFMVHERTLQRLQRENEAANLDRVLVDGDNIRRASEMERAGASSGAIRGKTGLGREPGLRYYDEDAVGTGDAVKKTILGDQLYDLERPMPAGKFQGWEYQTVPPVGRRDMAVTLAGAALGGSSPPGGDAQSAPLGALAGGALAFGGARLFARTRGGGLVTSPVDPRAYDLPAGWRRDATSATSAAEPRPQKTSPESQRPPPPTTEGAPGTSRPAGEPRPPPGQTGGQPAGDAGRPSPDTARPDPAKPSRKPSRPPLTAEQIDGSPALMVAADMFRQRGLTGDLMKSQMSEARKIVTEQVERYSGVRLSPARADAIARNIARGRSAGGSRLSANAPPAAAVPASAAASGDDQYYDDAGRWSHRDETGRFAPPPTAEPPARVPLGAIGVR